MEILKTLFEILKQVQSVTKVIEKSAFVFLS